MDTLGASPIGAPDSPPIEAQRARRYPLLPPGTGLGWTPYAWLVYLGSFLWWPMTGDAAPWQIAATFAVAAAFIPLYFWGYWQSGRRTVLPAAGMAILGTVGALWTPMAGVFFIYGSGYVGAAGSARWGLAILGGLLAWITAVSILLDPHVSFWLIGGVFTILIGGINLHFGQMAQKNASLRRSQAEVEHLAQVAERERIGRDLHDLLGHTLSLITLKSELAGKLFDRDPEAARREVAEIERVSRRALVDVREAVQGTRASGLVAEARRATASLQSASVQVETDLDRKALDVARRDPKIEGALAFVLREAVTNVLRHADAAHCEISLRLATGADSAGVDSPGVDFLGVDFPTANSLPADADDGGLLLTVSDDGRGGDSTEGFGLTGMRQRLAALGGRLERDGGGGTRIVARVPSPPRTATLPPGSPKIGGKTEAATPDAATLDSATPAPATPAPATLAPATPAPAAPADPSAPASFGSSSTPEVPSTTDAPPSVARRAPAGSGGRR